MTDEAVKVVVRCRPMNSKEVTEGRKSVVNVLVNESQVIIQNPDTNAISQDPKSFTFDAVYDDMSTQRAVYDETAYPLVESVMSGYNGTIFAYGQTGCGKTHTMQGRNEPPELRGVIPNSFDHIFDNIKLAREKEFLVRCSYLEIYNEEIRDLLGVDHNAKMELHEDPDRGVFVKDLSQVVVDSGAAIDKVMQDGNRHRTTGATLMNDQSSRSHSIFTIIIEMSRVDAADGKEHITRGKLNLVDLAGSERPAKTGATGTRMKEGIKINLSLTALGNVISALVEGATKTRHIPYRDSKLTRLLQDSLGGNTKTVMVAAIGPADYNYDETLSTLRYANRAKNIKNKPVINEDPKDALLRQYKEEIDRLRTLLVEHLSAAGIDTAALNAILAQTNNLGAAMAGAGGGGGGGGAMKALPAAPSAAAKSGSGSANAAKTSGGSVTSTPGRGGAAAATTTAAHSSSSSSTSTDNNVNSNKGEGGVSTNSTSTADEHQENADSSTSSSSNGGGTTDAAAGPDAAMKTNSARPSSSSNTSAAAAADTALDRPVTPNNASSSLGNSAEGNDNGGTTKGTVSLSEFSRASPRTAAAAVSAMSPTQSFRATGNSNNNSAASGSSSSSSGGPINTSMLGAEAQEAIEAARRDADRERKEREELARKLFALQQMVVGKGASSGGSGSGAYGRGGTTSNASNALGSSSSSSSSFSSATGSGGAILRRNNDDGMDDPEFLQARAREEQRREQNTAAKAKKAATSPGGDKHAAGNDDADMGVDDDNDPTSTVGGGNASSLLSSSSSQQQHLSPEERAKLTRPEKEKLVKKVKAKYQARLEALKQEILDLQDEHAQQRESLMNTVREQAKEANLLEALVSLFLSPIEVSKVWERAVWNDETEMWALPRVKPRPGFDIRTKAANKTRQPGVAGGLASANTMMNGGGSGSSASSSNNNTRGPSGGVQPRRGLGSANSGRSSGNDGNTNNSDGGSSVANYAMTGSVLSSDPGNMWGDNNSTASGDAYNSYTNNQDEEEDEDEAGGAVISDSEMGGDENTQKSSMPRLKIKNSSNSSNQASHSNGIPIGSTSLPTLGGGSSNNNKQGGGGGGVSSGYPSSSSLPVLGNSNNTNVRIASNNGIMNTSGVGGGVGSSLQQLPTLRGGDRINFGGLEGTNIVMPAGMLPMLGGNVMNLGGGMMMMNNMMGGGMMPPMNMGMGNMMNIGYTGGGSGVGGGMPSSLPMLGGGGGSGGSGGGGFLPPMGSASGGGPPSRGSDRGGSGSLQQSKPQGVASSTSSSLPSIGKRR